MSTLDNLAIIYNLSEDDKLKVLTLIESNEYLRAINMIRVPGEQLLITARVLKKIAKEELNLDIMPYVK